MTYLERCAKCGRVQTDHRFALHRFQPPGEMERDDDSAHGTLVLGTVDDLVDLMTDDGESGDNE